MFVRKLTKFWIIYSWICKLLDKYLHGFSLDIINFSKLYKYLPDIPGYLLFPGDGQRLSRECELLVISHTHSEFHVTYCHRAKCTQSGAFFFIHSSWSTHSHLFIAAVLDTLQSVGLFGYITRNKSWIAENCWSEDLYTVQHASTRHGKLTKILRERITMSIYLDIERRHRWCLSYSSCDIDFDGIQLEVLFFL